MDTKAAASMTHDKGFHIKPKNCQKGLMVFCSNRLGPNFSMRRVASVLVNPFDVVCNSSKTSPGSIVERSYLSLSYSSSTVS
ncbi:hypothetical protein BCR42DRAFT_400885, partial [Absidia repens]